MNVDQGRRHHLLGHAYPAEASLGEELVSHQQDRGPSPSPHPAYLTTLPEQRRKGKVLTLPLGQDGSRQGGNENGDRVVRGSSPLPTPGNVSKKWEWDGDEKMYHGALSISEGEALPGAVIDPAGV
jgi:hypothetical protein